MYSNGDVLINLDRVECAWVDGKQLKLKFGVDNVTGFNFRRNRDADAALADIGHFALAAQKEGK